ncbi:MAG: histidine kinase [Ferruginibacter sp.]
MLKPVCKIIALSFTFSFCTSFAVYAQQKEPGLDKAYPKEYFQLTTDTVRMRFLVKAINDSLDNDMLTHVYDWAKEGLAMAEKNNIDTMKGIFNFFIGKAFTYKYGKPDSAIFYYKRTLPYFPDRKRKYNVFSIREIMERYSEMGNKDSSFVYLDTLKAFIDTMPVSSPKRISLSQNIATVYQWFGMFKTAIFYYHVAINGQRKNGNLQGLALALANLGELYSESQEDLKAVESSKEALNYFDKINMPYMQTAANVATYYVNLQQFDSAFNYYKKADSAAVVLNDTQEKIVLQSVLGNIYLGKKKYALARPLFENNVYPLIQSGDRWNLAKTYFSLAALDSGVHNYRDAEKNLLKGLKIAREDKAEVLILIALQNLSIISSKLNNYKDAFEYQNEFILQTDSVTSEKTKANLADLEISYKTLEKEQHIELLQKDNDIKNLMISKSNRSKALYIAALAIFVVLFTTIYYQRGQRSKINIQKVKAELQTQVLRAQMNPHFIFNSLNSIENFIMRNEKRLASDYLNKFARLIRMILDSSRNEVVPISKDMETLQLYIDLEQLRFNDKFTFKTFTDPELLSGDYCVPSLLIQPYVENAIVHGLAHTEADDLYLTVITSLENNFIKYVIEDNGIGREQAAIYNMRNKSNHKSVGLSITENRINNFNDKININAVQITDLYNKNDLPCGTRVEIHIKAI